MKYIFKSLANKTKTKEIFKSLAKFQQEVPVIYKGTEGYGYLYADLVAIFEVINPLLKKNNLGFTQLVNKEVLKTILFHTETGETIESETFLQTGVSLAKMNDFQILGSQITYLRRYAISAILGLVTDKDTDAQGEQQPIVKIEWLTETQFKNTLKQDNDYIERVLKTFNTSTKKMKIEYKTTLELKLKDN